MAVAAGNRHARLGQAALGTDDMDDAVLAALGREIADAGGCDIALQFLDLGLVLAVGIGAGEAGRGVGVVLGGEGPLRVAHGQATAAEILESGRAGDLLDEMKTNKELVGAARQAAHDVAIKNLLIQGLRHGLSFQKRSPGQPRLRQSHTEVHIGIPIWMPLWRPGPDCAIDPRGGYRWHRCRTYIRSSGR
jgi:hypothetical protein